MRGVLVVVLGAISPVWLPPPLERAREGLKRWRKRLPSPGNGYGNANGNRDSNSDTDSDNNFNNDGDRGDGGGGGGRGRHDESKVCCTAIYIYIYDDILVDGLPTVLPGNTRSYGVSNSSFRLEYTSTSET